MSLMVESQTDTFLDRKCQEVIQPSIPVSYVAMIRCLVSDRQVFPALLPGAVIADQARAAGDARVVASPSAPREWGSIPISGTPISIGEAPREVPRLRAAT